MYVCGSRLRGMTNKRQAPAKHARTVDSDAERPVAMTLKVDRDTYRRLAAFSVSGTRLRTHQEIMLTALKDYLDKNKA